jgi:hypothetical protein
MPSLAVEGAAKLIGDAGGFELICFGHPDLSILKCT